MLATLIPLFDENMTVKAYSLFSQKKNFFLNPSYFGTGSLDGAGSIVGLDIINSIGIENLSQDSDIFVPVNCVSLFADIENQCIAPHSRIVLLLDNTVKPQPMYVARIEELKNKGYRFAIRKLDVPEFENYRLILGLMDYIFLDHKKIVIAKARVYFSKVYPSIKLIAGNIVSNEAFESLKNEGGYQLYEGEFYRTPITKGKNEIAPVKVNYIELLNIINSPDYELTDAADIIARDAALTISLLGMVNRMTVNNKISNIRQAAALLGQRELKKWITTAVTKQLCEDRPSEIARVSMLRAKFAENLANVFGLGAVADELFMMGLFSCLDIILETTMEKALDMLNVSKKIGDALISGRGDFAQVFDFMIRYESGDWVEIDRLTVVNELDIDAIYDAYINSLKWFRNLFE